MRDSGGKTFWLAEELAERWNLMIRSGSRKGQPNVHYLQRKARLGEIPAIKLPGSNHWRFPCDAIRAMEAEALNQSKNEIRSLKPASQSIQRSGFVQEKEPLWE